jgi:hypothetical protein
MKYTLIYLDAFPLEGNESRLPAVELLELARGGVGNPAAVVNRVTVDPSEICLEFEAEVRVECEPSELPKVAARSYPDDMSCTVLDERGGEVSLRRSCVLNFDDSATFGGEVNLSALSEEGLEAKIKADYFGFLPDWASVTLSDIEVSNGKVGFTADVVYEADGLGEFIGRVRELVWECIGGDFSSFDATYGAGDGQVTVTELDFNAHSVYMGDLFEFKGDVLP